MLVVAVTLLFISKTVRTVNRAMPPAWLIWVQTYRMAGLMFLYPFLYYGVVPAGFAVPAGVGDFLTVAVAPVGTSIHCEISPLSPDGGARQARGKRSQHAKSE